MKILFQLLLLFVLQKPQIRSYIKSFLIIICKLYNNCIIFITRLAKRRLLIPSVILLTGTGYISHCGKSIITGEADLSSNKIASI